MYASAADALVRLLEGGVDKSPCKITGMPHQIIYLNNGIKYYAVEVTSEAGAQYGITAYNEEAEELYRAAKGSAAVKRLLSISTSK